MKTIARLALVTTAALGAALFFSGCTTSRTTSIKRSGHFYDLTVVQSSGPVDMSPKEMSQLRESVISYVQAHGVLHNGAYYVEVKFKPVEGDADGGWIVVKLVERNVGDYEMVASYSNSWPDYYDPFYYRSGYASFGNYPFDSFDYAYDGGYLPPRHYPRSHPPTDDDDHHNGNDDHHNGNDHHRDNDHRHEGGRGDVAGNDGQGGSWHHSAGSSGNDHRPPEPRHWERGDSSPTASNPPSSSDRNDSGPSYSPPPAPSPEPTHSEPIGRDTAPVAAK